MKLIPAIVAYSGVILMLLAATFRRSHRARRADLATAVAFTAMMGFGINLLLWMNTHLPATMDTALLAADRSVGLDPIRFAHSLPVCLFRVVDYAYLALPAMIGLAWVAEQNRVLRAAAILGGLFCFVGYALCPAVGPNYFNWKTGIAPQTYRNCMPSMHMTWALLIAWNARHRWLRLGAWLYVAVMLVATIGLGEHYFVDVAAAVPFAALMQRAARIICVRRVIRTRQEATAWPESI